MFSKPAKANRPNLKRRMAAANEALEHAMIMLQEILDEGNAGKRRRDRRAEKALKPLGNASAWLHSAMAIYR